MNNPFSILTVLLTGLLILCPVHILQADDDHIEAKRLLNSGEIMALDDILKIIKQTYPGKLLEVELEKEHKKIVYEVEILGTDGIVREIYIDAKTGKLISIKEDD